MAQKKTMAEKTDKRRRAKIKVGVKADGSPHYRWVAGKTQAKVAESKNEVKRLTTRGVLADKNITVQEYARRWLHRHVIEPGRAPATVAMYRSALNAHILPAFGTRYLASVQSGELQDFINKLKGASESKVDQVMLALGRLFRRAMIDGIITVDPTLGLDEPTTAVKIDRRAMTLGESEAALRVGNAHPEGLLLLVLYYLGVRRGEARGLDWRDINWREKTIHVCRDIDPAASDEPGDPKSEAADRVIPIPDPLFAALRAQARTSGYIITAPGGGVLGSSTFERRWNRLMVAMVERDDSIAARPVTNRIRKAKPPREGKPGPKPKPPAMRSILTPHYFRHNYASILYTAGVRLEVAADWLGHADINVTRKIYIHLAHETLVAQSVGLLEFFNGCQKVAIKTATAIT